jgi:uncharacterized protein (DUF433 family)
MLDEQVTIRIGASVLAKLKRRAQERLNGETTALARRYIEEGLAMDHYPGIVFREGSGGRRPALAGRRLDIAAIIETLRSSKNDRAATAEYFEISQREVDSAVAYYVDHKSEIDAWIDEQQRANQEQREAWERQRSPV